MDVGKLEAVGGPLFITQCTSKVASVANIEKHIFILRDKYLRRELIRLSHQLIKGAYDESIDLTDVIEAGQRVFMTALNYETGTMRRFSDVATDLLDRMYALADGKPAPCVKTGFDKFDEFANGFQFSDLVIIGGETSHGKTTLAINLARNIARNDIPVAFYSLEMTSLQLVSRIVASVSGIDSKTLMNKPLFREEFLQAEGSISKIMDIPIFFDESSTSSLNTITSSIRRMVLKFGIKVVFVDYLQLVKGDSSAGREEEVGNVARVLKNVAKELDIVVIVLSQLKRAEDPVPTMRRLRASGQIEEAADVVMLVWIPELVGYANLTDSNGREINMKDKADVIIGKGRNIGTMNFTVSINRRINLMTNEQQESFSPNRDFETPAGWVDGNPF